MSSKKRFLAALAALNLCLPASALTQGDWPSHRNDDTHLGRSDLPGEMTHPEVLRTHYLGGRVSQHQAMAVDLLGDGARELVVIERGRVTVRDGNGAVLAESPAMGLDRIHGVWDFNGDGVMDVLARSRYRLAIVSAEDGTVQWEGRSPTGFGRIGVLDLDGDDFPELLANRSGESSCANDLVRVDFEDGFTVAQQVLYIDDVSCHYLHWVAGRFDDAGGLTLAIQREGRLSLHDADTGLERASLTTHTGGARWPEATLWARDLDDDGDTDFVWAGARGGSDEVVVNLFAAYLDEGRPTLGWEREIARGQGGLNVELRHVASSLSDVDLDEASELVVSIYNDDDSGHWRLEVIEAASGATTHTVPHRYIEDVVALEAGDESILIASNAAGAGALGPSFSGLYGYAMDEEGLLEQWRINDVGAHRVPRPPHGEMGGSVRSAIARQDVNGDGALDLYVERDGDDDGLADTLEVWSVVDTPIMLARFEVDKGVLAQASVLATGDHLSSDSSERETWVSINDGTNAVLGLDLYPTTRFQAGHFRTSALVAAGISENASVIAVHTSRGQVRLLRAEGREQLEPIRDLSPGLGYWPTLLRTGPDQPWTLPLPTLDGLEVVVSGHRLDGSVAWQVETEREAPDNWPIFRTAHFDHEGSDELITALYNPDVDKVDVVALDIDTGSLRWSYHPKLDDTRFARDPVVFDLEPNGLSDVLYDSSRSTLVMLGHDGALRTWSTRIWGYVAGIAFADVHGGGGGQIMRGPDQNGLGSYLTRNGAPGAQYYTDFATLRAPMAFMEAHELRGLEVLVADIYGGVRALQFTAGPVVELWRVYLSHGEVFSEDPGDGGLPNAPVVADIDGDGAEEAIVSSSDGFLYALSGEGELEWVVDVGSELGEPILADLDRDGLVEVLVSSADGLLNVVGQPHLEAPPEVRDVAISPALALGDPSLDVDESDVLSAAGVAVEPVAGAVGFSARVVSETGTAVSDWVDFEGTFGAIYDIRLAVGRHYTIEARLIDELGEVGMIGESDGFVATADSTGPVLSIEAVPWRVPNPALVLVDVNLTGYVVDPAGIADARLTLRARGAAHPIADWSLDRGSASIAVDERWDGMDSDGFPGSPGEYDVTLWAEDVVGNSARMTATLLISSEDRLDDLGGDGSDVADSTADGDLDMGREVPDMDVADAADETDTGDGGDWDGGQPSPDGDGVDGGHDGGSDYDAGNGFDSGRTLPDWDAGPQRIPRDAGQSEGTGPRAGGVSQPEDGCECRSAPPGAGLPVFLALLGLLMPRRRRGGVVS